MEQTLQQVKDLLCQHAERMETALRSLYQKRDEDLEKILDAQTYSLWDGGKRIRPFIVNEVCRMLGGKEEVSMPYACALEMVHTYSLIHDDLPCMDDDDMRRGRPSNHKVFGYATALLAGDALLTRAFGIMAENPYADAKQNVQAVSLLAKAAGDFGMIGGQVMDLAGEVEDLEMEQLLKLHAMKTGALMECAARLGALAAGYSADSEVSCQVALFARKIGLAFQVVDDILDEIGDETLVGKPLRSDHEHNKTTFMTYYSPNEARTYAANLTAEAISAISELKDSEVLTDLAVYLMDRTF